MAGLDGLTTGAANTAGTTDAGGLTQTQTTPYVPPADINQQYQDLFGRAADESGAKYWAGTGLTGDALRNAMISGAQGTDLSHYQAAQDYQSLFGRAADEPGLNYWTQSGLTGDTLKQAMLAGAQGSDITAAPLMQNISTTNQNVLGPSYQAPTGYNEYQTDLQKKVLSGQMTTDQYNTELQNSTYNKAQEANRLAGIAKSLYGMSDADAVTLARDAYQGKTTSSDLDKYYNQLLTNPNKAMSDILTERANSSDAATNPYFQKNPDLLSVYKNIGDTTSFTNAGTGGQYGYYQGIPILKASEADKVFDQLGTDYVQGNAPDRLDNSMGWDTGSLSAVEARGAGALGIKKDTTQANPFTGEPSQTTYSGDMDSVAKQLGLDPTKYTSQDDLYNAINDKAKNFYYIAGKTGTGKTNDKGETSAFTRNDVSGNHAGVLYQKQGDKLIPIPNTLKYYNGQMELSPGSFFKDFAPIAMMAASIFAPQLAAAYGGGALGAAGAGATIGAGGAALTGGDILKGAALGGAGGYFSSPDMLGNIGSSFSNIGITDPGIQNILARGTVNLGMNIAGGAPLENALLNTGLNLGLNQSGIPNTPATNLATSIAAPLITTGKVNPMTVANSALRTVQQTQPKPAKQGGLVSMKTGGKVQHFEDGGDVSYDWGSWGDTGGASYPTIDYGGLDLSGVNYDFPSFLDTTGGFPDLTFDTNYDVANALDLANATDYLQNADTGVNFWDQPENNYAGISTQVFDDGSEIRIDDQTQQVVGGTDTEGRDFVVGEDGVAHYVDTGEGLGGTPVLNFGGNLANKADVDKLLKYNATGVLPTTPTVPTTPRSPITPNVSNVPATRTAAQQKSGQSGTQGGLTNLVGSVTKPTTGFTLSGTPTYQSTVNPMYKAAGGRINLPQFQALNNYIDHNYDSNYAPQMAKGGSTQGGGLDHVPEFYSEGGLKHRYVKGRGDGTSDEVPAMLANGEFVIPADVVSGLGNGSNDSGAKILDEFLKVIRRDKRAAGPDKLPADSKGPQAYLLQAKRKVRK